LLRNFSAGPDGVSCITSEALTTAFKGLIDASSIEDSSDNSTTGWTLVGGDIVFSSSVLPSLVHVEAFSVNGLLSNVLERLGTQSGVSETQLPDATPPPQSQSRSARSRIARALQVVVKMPDEVKSTLKSYEEGFSFLRSEKKARWYPIRMRGTGKDYCKLRSRFVAKWKHFKVVNGELHHDRYI
jgi:hypothetical protein